MHLFHHDMDIAERIARELDRRFNLLAHCGRLGLLPRVPARPHSAVGTACGRGDLRPVFMRLRETQDWP